MRRKWRPGRKTYGLILLIAMAIAEAVHAPIIGRSQAQAPAVVMVFPQDSAEEKKPASEAKQPGDPVTVDPLGTSDISIDEPKKKRDLSSLLKWYFAKESEPIVGDLNTTPVDAFPMSSVDGSALSANAGNDSLPGSSGASSSQGGTGIADLSPFYSSPQASVQQAAPRVHSGVTVPEPGSGLCVILSGLLYAQRRNRRMPTLNEPRTK